MRILEILGVLSSTPRTIPYDILVVYPNEYGSVNILYPCIKDPGHPISTDEIVVDLASQIDRSVPEGSPYKIIGKDQVPSSRADRDTWTLDTFDGPIYRK